MFQKRAMDENIAAAYFAQKNKFGDIIEKAGIVEGGITLPGQDEAQDVMFHGVHPAKYQAGQKPGKQADRQTKN